MLGKLTSAVSGVVLLCTTTPAGTEAPPTVTCYEDEVIVWTDDRHEACVALDDMYYDHSTGTVHWYEADERCCVTNVGGR